MSMQISNFFQMNDWQIGKFLKMVLAIQLALWILIGMNALGLQIPIIRQLIGFIYLTFVPGIIILRILKLHKLNSIETLLYPVGLSLATLMFTGLFMNTIYPLLGISKPISIVPLIITISIVVSILCALSYVRDKDFSEPSFIDFGDLLSPPTLFLCLIPFLAVFGTYLVNFYHNNNILMILIVILALIVLLITFDKFIPKNLYPLAVFVIAISLLYHRSLISMYLWGWDIHLEYYFSSLVRIAGYWDSTIPPNINAMLSIVMLAPIYSNICSMSLTWVFKIIYPLLFSLVPLGLYQVFQKQTDDKIAFLSCFFFMSLFTFYSEMLALARQEIAEVFLVLLILVIINKNMNKIKRSFLFIVFGASLVVSHYGTSYLYMFLLIGVWLTLFLLNSAIQKLAHEFHFKLRGYDSTIPSFRLSRDRVISSTFVILFVTFTLAWYMYNSYSRPFNTIVNVSNHIVSNIYTDFLSPEASEALNKVLSKTVSPLHEITKILHHITQFFIIVGIIDLLFKHKYTNRFDSEYSVFSILFFAGYFVTLAFPYSGFGTTRLYHLSLIFLAPFCVIGGITVFNVLNKIVKVSQTDQCTRSLLKVLSAFFAIFLLFNSGWVYEVAKDHPASIALSQESIKRSRDTRDKATLYNALNVFEQDVFSAGWLDHNVNKSANTKVYVDYISSHPLISYGMTPLECQRMLSNTTTNIEPGAFVFLGYPNVIDNMAMERSKRWPVSKELLVFNTTELSPFLMSINKIYTNGGSEIYVR